MKALASKLQLLIALSLNFIYSNAVDAQIDGLTHYQWPTESGQAIISDRYSVSVKSVGGEYIKLPVLMPSYCLCVL